MSSANDTLAGELCRELDQLSGDRGTFEAHWEEIAQRVFPAYAGQFQNQGLINPGAKRSQEIYDSTAPIALGRFAAVMESMLTPRNQKWHRLVAGDSALKKDRQVRLWLEEANTILFKHRYSPKANFASQIHQNYMGLGSFGTGCVLIDELDSGPGMRYRAVHLGEIYFVENHQGIVDKALRKFPLTARQARQKFGEDNLPPQIKAALATTPEKTFQFLHCVKPREDVAYGRSDYKGMSYASYYVSHDYKLLISEGGYNTFPYAISRYVQAPGETYGRSPAMDALPAIKTLNEEKKTLLKQGHRAVDPVLLLHDDGIMDGFSLTAGALNYGGVNADGRPMVHALQVGNLAIGDKMMQDERAVINDAFLVTLFQILTESPEMTATEVLERVREKGMLLSPTMGRQQSEMLGPMIERELDLLARQHLLPPMPPALQEARGEYDIQYDSPLSRAQRAEEAAGLQRTVQWALEVAQVTQKQEVLDRFDWDTIVPDMADIQAVPARWLLGDEAVATIREQRQQAQDAQQAVDAAPAAAAMMKQTSAGAR